MVHLYKMLFIDDANYEIQIKLFTSIELCFIIEYRSQMPQVGLIANDHDDSVWVGVVTQFLQPAMINALKR